MPDSMYDLDGAGWAAPQSPSPEEPDEVVIWADGTTTRNTLRNVAHAILREDWITANALLASVLLRGKGADCDPKEVAALMAIVVVARSDVQGREKWLERVRAAMVVPDTLEE